MSSITYHTNVPTLTWTDDGITLPEPDAILNGFIQDVQNAFPDAVLYDSNGKFLLSTPWGQLITSWAAVVLDKNNQIAFYANQVDPSYAMGRMQDGIGRIYFIERRPATYTEVVGLCRGGVSVLIPKGTYVADSANNKYRAKQDYTIGDDGTVNVTFICETKGAIECPANSLSMYEIITGWDSVSNPKAGVVGRNLESQQQFEQRRRQSVAGNSVNSVDSIMSALLTLTDANGNPVCQDVYVTENNLSEGITNGSVFLKPHSIYICVAALDSQENEQFIAKTIWNKKPPGCAMTGDKVVTIEDDSGLYSTAPTYKITYSYAVSVPIFFQIVMARSQDQPKNAADQIKNAVYNAFTGEDGSIRPRIGSRILASDFFRPVLAIGNWARVISIQIARDGMYSNSISMGIDEIPTLTKDNITVIFNG